MSATTIQTTIAETKQAKESYVNWEAFQQDHLLREDGFDYEWLDGKVEKTPISMDKTQLFIARNILKYFRNLLFEKKVHGELLPESDLFFLKNHRRPDICWLTDTQIDRLAIDEYEVPAFVVEIISKTDQKYRVESKMNDYRAAGVKVVWHIFPEHEHVHIYTGERLENIRVYMQGETCTATPVLPNFEMPVEKIFEHSMKKER